MSHLLKFFLAIAFSAAIAFPAYADSKEDKIRELIELSGGTRIMETMRSTMIQQIGGMLDQKLPDISDSHRAEFIQIITSEFEASLPGFMDAMIPIYDDALTENEIDDAITFFKTPSGQSFSEKQPQMVMKGMQAGRTWGMALGERISKRIQAKAQELGYNI